MFLRVLQVRPLVYKENKYHVKKKYHLYRYRYLVPAYDKITCFHFCKLSFNKIVYT